MLIKKKTILHNKTCASIILTLIINFVIIFDKAFL